MISMPAYLYKFVSARAQLLKLPLNYMGALAAPLTRPSPQYSGIEIKKMRN